MNFPEIATAANNAIILLQVIGIAVVGVCIALIALMVITSFGNEHKLALAKTSGIGVAIGLFILLGAPKIALVFQALVSFIKK